jgi:hypothetical protein
MSSPEEIFGVKKEKYEGPTVPKDYVWKRGPEQKAFEGAEAVVEPPKGYYKINICGGAEVTPGFRNMNPVKVNETDVVWSVENLPWPFDDGTVMELNIGPYICQIPNLDQFMDEAYRVLVPNGKLTVLSPYYTSIAYWRNIRNITPITEDTFGFYCVGWLKARKVMKKVTCDFEPVGNTFFYSEDYALYADQTKEFARKHYWNVCEAMQATLCAVKPMRSL